MSSVSPLKDERPIIFPFQYALASLSLSLCGFPRGLDGRKMKFSREKKLGVVET